MSQILTYIQQEYHHLLSAGTAATTSVALSVGNEISRSLISVGIGVMTWVLTRTLSYLVSKYITKK